MDFNFCNSASTSAFVFGDSKPIVQNPSLPAETSFQPQSKRTGRKAPYRSRNGNKLKEFLAKKAQKRLLAKMDPNGENNANVPPKRERLSKILADDTKSPMMRLNELRVPYSLILDAIPNSSLFKAIVTINGSTFEGVASSKQDAKQKVATEVLLYFSSEAGVAASRAALGSSSPSDIDIASLGKTPVSIINEMFGANGWCVLSEEAVGLDFEVKISLGKHGDFSAKARSKKEAKHAAALAGVLSIFQIPSIANLTTEQLNSVIQHFRQYGTAPLTTSPSVLSNVGTNISNSSSSSSLPGIPSTAGQNRSILSNGVDKSHLQILNEKFGPDKVCFSFCGEEGTPNQKTFHVRVKVQGIDDEFVASGSSKQVAKQNAAAMVLASLSINEPVGSMEVTPVVKEPAVTSNAWSDFMARMVQNKFQELTDGTEWSRRAVLAGIVMTIGDDYEATAQLICVSTGTKCISANSMSMTGSALLDCHAEILCRRALCRYFYSHLLAMGNPELAATAIFEPRPDGKPGYRLKPAFRFHLYISTAPCGDARIFVPLDDAAAMVTDANPQRINRGLLRTKVESGEGTIPSVEEARQTWDGVMGGDRLLVVSCSDKMLAWNYLGIQGNLLTHYVEPVYLSSIVIGSAFNLDHLKRALITRLADYKPPNENYILHEPTILSTSRLEQRMPCKPPKYSLLWTVCDPAFEIIDCATGRIGGNRPSSVSKLTLFRLYSTIDNKLSKIIADDETPSQQPPRYSQMKKRNTDYKATKVALMEAFCTNFLGMWPTKPHEIDDFQVPTM